ncbi:MAG: hypothetical protein MN733_06570 [Nitrososphaera sp.]|nr:hypothetical protein [Nitrososphaera sp.]
MTSDKDLSGYRKGPTKVLVPKEFFSEVKEEYAEKVKGEQRNERAAKPLKDTS